MPRNVCRPAVDLIVGMGTPSPLSREVAASPVQRLVANDNDGDDSGLSTRNQALLSVLLELGRVDSQNVILGFKALMVGQQNDVLNVVVELSGGLLGGREMLVKSVKRLVAERVGLDDVGRNVLVRRGEPRDRKDGEGFVNIIAKLDELLAIIICFQGVDAVTDERVVQ